jgi:hypothetical protein
LKNLNEHEPAPEQNDLPAVWDLVLADIKERDKVGQERYGIRLQPFNGRDALVDAYQEALDLVVYLRQAIYERDKGYVAPNWERPTRVCPTCEVLMDLVAVDTGDGWDLIFECPACLDQSESIIDDWPFSRDWASPEDWQKIGVRVE